MAPEPPEDDDERRTVPRRAQDDDERRTVPGSAEDSDRMSKWFAAVIGAMANVEAPAALGRVCVDLLDISGASICLYGEDLGVRTLWWSSDRVAGRLAEAQYTLGDGPCLTAVSQGAPVFADDLTRGRDAERWPLFAQQAVDLGVRAVFCLPLGNDGHTFGTFDLYRSTPGPLSEGNRSFAFPAAEAITTALVALQVHGARTGVGDAWVSAAETEHEEVHQATGMIMVHLGVDPAHALARLRAHAFSHGLTVTEAAFDVIAGRIRFHD